MECQKVGKYLLQIPHKRSQRFDTFQRWNSTAQGEFLQFLLVSQHLFLSFREDDGEQFNPDPFCWQTCEVRPIRNQCKKEEIVLRILTQEKTYLQWQIK